MNILKTLQAPNEPAPALISKHGAISYEQLYLLVERYADILKSIQPKCIAIYLDNCSHWVIADLAAHLANIPVIPLPTFFSQAQLSHMLEDAGVDTIITHRLLTQQPILSMLNDKPVSEDEHGFQIYQREISNSINYPTGLAKITYTSGSTGAPKGVCLNTQSQLNVANSLSTVLQSLEIKKHLCLLPLSTLLENIAGVWAPLSIGASIAIPSLMDLGFGGASNLDPEKFLSTIASYDPESIILVPELLNILVTAYETGIPQPKAFKFIAVGGAKVSSSLLERARKLGLPVFEGYGLSEACSVTTLNTPLHNKPGTSGKALPHVKLRISVDNEIEVAGSNMLGYLNETAMKQEYYPTGDLGEIDEDGFIIIHGRKKNMFITSFGRQVNPEWVEESILQHSQISQAVVFGEGLPFNIAVIVPTEPNILSNHVDELINTSNDALPDYAKISHYVIAEIPFNAEEDMLTTNGRVKRNNIYNKYSKQIEDIIMNNSNHESNTTRIVA